jgi:hypothetical protein
MSSVTFSTGVGGDGSTVTDDNNATTGLREGGWKTRFVPCFTQQVAVANYIVTKAGEASTSASAASSSATAAAASYDSFDDRYLGAKSSDPSVDNDGNTLLTGAIYWNSTSSVMKVWSGSAWVSYNPAISYLALSGGTMTGAITFAAGQFGTNVNTFLSTPSSANLAAALTDETGSGAAVFATSPTLVTPVLGTPSSGTLSSCTGLPLTTGITGTLPVGNGGTGLTSPSTTGNVLTSNGTTWESSAPSSGAMTLISTTTASSASDVTFTGLTTYNNYRIVISGLTFSSTATLELRFGQPSITTSGYYHSVIYLDSIAIQRGYSSSDSRIYIVGSALSTNASMGVAGTVDVYDMTSGKYPKTISNVGLYNSESRWTFAQTWGISTNVSGFPTTVIKIYPGGGTFSGTISIYGITA